MLLSTGDYIAALDMIDTTMEILRTELASVVSLKHLQQQLQEVKLNTARVIQNDFLTYILSDANMKAENFAGLSLSGQTPFTQSLTLSSSRAVG